MAAARAARGLPGADSRAMSHSWLFTGPPGSGRSNAALAFAAALMCTNPDTNGPEAELGCGQCDACRSVLDTQSHTDLKFWAPQGLTIKVDEVRGVIKDAIALPTHAKFRVIIFDNADRMTPGASMRCSRRWRSHRRRPSSSCARHQRTRRISRRLCARVAATFISPHRRWSTSWSSWCLKGHRLPMPTSPPSLLFATWDVRAGWSPTPRHKSAVQWRLIWLRTFSTDRKPSSPPRRSSS